MTMQMERRDAAVAWPDQDFDFRADGSGLAFKGYAAVFNSRSEDLGGFRETLAPGAFKRSIGGSHGRAIKAFLNHNQDVVLGNTKKGTLRLSEDDRGLLAEADLPDNHWGRYAADAMRRGDVDAMSFGFVATRDAWSPDHKTRELIEVRLLEVSPVVWPAYPATSATVRHLAQVAGVDEDLMQAALDALRGEDELPDQHRDVLIAAINARSATRFIPQSVADDIAARRARLAVLIA